MEHFLGQFNIWFIITAALLSIWSLIWKGYAMWESARLGHKWWFVIILLTNSVGILEIIYIFVVARRTKTDLQIVQNKEQKNTGEAGGRTTIQKYYS